MEHTIHIVACPLDTKSVAFETGLLAGQADGAVVVRCGDSVVMSAVVASKSVREGIDFFPLTVDYFEKTYAAGKIPGGFFKREGRPTTKEILTCRLIDRPIRPLFPDHYYNEVQVAAYVLSYDTENQVDIMAMNAASCALYISEIPFTMPIGAVRVGRVDDVLVLNPSLEQCERSTLDMIVAGTEQAITMVESGAKELSEEQLVEALAFAHEHIKKLTAAQKELAAKVGKTKRVVEPPAVDTILEGLVKETVFGRIKEALRIPEKSARKAKFQEAGEALDRAMLALGEEQAKLKAKPAKAIMEGLISTEMRRLILEEDARIDGRNLTTVRPISCAVGFLPRCHGSALFTRGQTQALAITTLGASSESQIIDGLDEEFKKHFMLHYNFPSFSTGETKPMRGPGRREIGHGALAERALLQMVPGKETFPYAIRIVSEILSSNGSSSMASVCAGSLALMDAGVPMKAPVAGIAMGLIKENDRFKVLSDILGDEDHFGDMDFKVAGTTKGVTALQMDIKINGVTVEIMRTALNQAKEGRLHILGKMSEALAEPRADISKYAPRILSIDIDPEKIRNVIGPGGKVIRKIQEDFKVIIEAEDGGRINIISPDLEAAERAIQTIRALTEDAEIGKVYTGKVKRLMKFGAFVEILPGIEGMVHISQLDHARVNRVEDVVNIGDEITVKVIEIDNQGRVNMSRKAVMPEPAGGSQEQREPRENRDQRDFRPRDRGDRNDRGPRRDNNSGE